MNPPGSPFPRPRGQAAGPAPAACNPAAQQRQQWAGGGGGWAAALAPPPPPSRPAPTATSAADGMDSLDALLGDGHGSIGASSRPHTAVSVRPQYEANSLTRPLTHASLFADDDSLPLPGDEDHIAESTEPASVTHTIAATGTASLGLLQSLPSHPPAQQKAQQEAQQPQCHAPLLHNNPAYQSRPGSTAASPDVVPPWQPLQHASAAAPQQQQVALQASLAEHQAQLQELAARLCRAEDGEAAARQALAAAQAEVQQLQHQLEGTNEAAVEQMLDEVDRLAAAKQQMERESAQLREQLAQAQAERSWLDTLQTGAAADLAAAKQQAEAAQRRAEELESEAQERSREVAAVKEQLAAATADWNAASEAAQQLPHRQAELAAATQQAAVLAKQLAAAEAEAASAAAAARAALGRQQEAEAEAAALDGQLQRVAAELDECRQHLASGQEIIREFERHLRTVAGERDAALDQLEFVEGRREEAERRLREAERKEAYNARRQADLDALQAEADGVVQHLREQQRALAAREREAGLLEKQLALREKDVAAREGILKEQQADSAQQEEGALALKQQLLHQQQELERARAQLNQQRSAMEVEQAQVQRDRAGLAQERSLLAELRCQRMAEQEVLMGQLAGERAAAAAQQSSAERAVDAARGAELSAARLLADLQAQAAKTKHETDISQQRLEKLQERCAAEEARLAGLQAAVLEQRQSFDAQVHSLLELGQQVKGQSQDLSCGYQELQEAQSSLEQQQQQLKEQQQALEAERKAAQAEKAEAEAAVQQAAEARLAAAAQQRKLGQERLESIRAAEAAHELQLRLAAQLRAASAAQVPQAAELWAELRAAVGVDSLPLLPADLEICSTATTAAVALPSPVAVAGASWALPAASARGASVVAPTSYCPAPTSPTKQPAAEDSSRYRSILADLERSIETWRGQLRACEPLTYAGSVIGGGSPGAPYVPGCSLGGASFFLPPAPAATLAAAACSPPARSCRSPGKQKQARQRQRCQQSKARCQAAAESEGEEERDHSCDDSSLSGDDEGQEEGCAVQRNSPSRAVQTAVSYLDAPRAIPDSIQCARSVPCSPSRNRGGIAKGATAARPASASAAVQAGGRGSRGTADSSPAGSFTGRQSAAGSVRAVQGLTIPAEYSLPGSPQHGGSKPPKWLKFKSSGSSSGAKDGVQPGTHSTGEMDGCGSAKGGGWGGIFAFRRSVDGAAAK